MFWLRWLLFASPAAMGFGAVWLFDRMGALELADAGGALVCAVTEPVGPLNPLVPQSGVAREIRDLLFEPLLVRDGEGELRPRLVEGWSFRTVVAVSCESEEAAGLAEAGLLSGDWLPAGIGLAALERSGTALVAELEGFDPALGDRLVAGFEEGVLGDDLLVTLDLRHSARDSFEAFLERSVEKGRIRMLEYRGDTGVDIFVRGDEERFLRELELYYESNRGLDPVIATAGRRSHTVSCELILELRRDVLWHDGTPFTADDVLFSHAELTRPDSPLPLGPSFWYVERLEKLSPHRIKAVCGDTPATALEAWERLPALPAHLLGGTGRPGGWGAFFELPVGTGPYRAARRRDDGGIDLVAWEGHFLAPPAQREVVYRRFDTREELLFALSAGALDLLVPDQRLADWALRNPGALTALRGPVRFQHLVAWNLDDEPFDRPEVRTALALATDVEALLLDSPEEFQVPPRGLLPPGGALDGSPMALPGHDPEEAARLLEDAGLPLDPDRGLRTLGGEPFVLRLTVNRDHPGHQRFADALAGQWREAGIETEVEAVEWSRIVSETLPRREFQAVLLGWELTPARDLHAVWHSSAAADGSGNLPGLRDATVDGLLERIRREADPAEARALAASLQDEIARLQPCLFLAESGRILGLRSGGVGLAPAGADQAAAPVPLETLAASAPEGASPFAERSRWVRIPPARRRDAGGAAQPGAAPASP